MVWHERKKTYDGKMSSAISDLFPFYVIYKTVMQKVKVIDDQEQVQSISMSHPKTPDGLGEKTDKLAIMYLHV